MTEPVLLTPGPGTTAMQTRAAMTRDWGSWDSGFAAITSFVVRRLEHIADPLGHALRCVPLQGSGTFAVEAALRTLVPRGGEVIVAIGGAYGARIAEIARRAGRRPIEVRFAENEPASPEAIAQALADYPEATHVALVHCETSTGLLNPLRDIADTVEMAGRRLIVDAMSTFGALNVQAGHPAVDAVIAASGKCLEGPPGMGFVLLNPQVLEGETHCDSLALDLVDQHRYLEATGQWRFTPPTHVVAALAAAIELYEAEGGRTARLARYRRNGLTLVRAMADLGFASYLPENLQAPIIYTFRSPTHPRWSFPDLYQAVKRRGYVLYPGKLTTEETFRVGCIGAIDAGTMTAAVAAIGEALAELGIVLTSPAQAKAVAR